MIPVSVFDWTIYLNMFNSPRMVDIFDEHGTLQRMVNAEKAINKAQDRLSIITAVAADHIVATITADTLNSSIPARGHA